MTIVIAAYVPKCLHCMRNGAGAVFLNAALGISLLIFSVFSPPLCVLLVVMVIVCGAKQLENDTRSAQRYCKRVL